MKTIKNIYRFVIVLFIILLSTVYCPQSQAQQVSFALSPPLLEVLIKPGKSILIAYKLDNFGDPVIVSSHVLPFEPSNKTGQIRIKEEFEGPVRFSLENADIALSQPSLLRTLESKQFLLRIRVPEGAPEGDYYYTFLATTEPPPSIGDATSSRARATIGSNILITVSSSGKLDIRPKIILFDVLSRFKLPFFGKPINIFDSNDPVRIVMIAENQGKNMIKPLGNIMLRGNFGERATYSIVPKNILADSQRYISASPSAEIPSSVPTTLNLKGFFVGKYNLTAEMSFGEGTPNLFSSTSFIALPFKFIIAFLATIVAAYILIRKYKNW